MGTRDVVLVLLSLPDAAIGDVDLVGAGLVPLP